MCVCTAQRNTQKMKSSGRWTFWRGPPDLNTLELQQPPATTHTTHSNGPYFTRHETKSSRQILTKIAISMGILRLEMPNVKIKVYEPSFLFFDRSFILFCPCRVASVPHWLSLRLQGKLSAFPKFRILTFLARKRARQSKRRSCSGLWNQCGSCWNFFWERPFSIEFLAQPSCACKVSFVVFYYSFFVSHFLSSLEFFCCFKKEPKQSLFFWNDSQLRPVLLLVNTNYFSKYFVSFFWKKNIWW